MSARTPWVRASSGVALVALLASTGCRIGSPGPASSRPATSPHGATIRIDWREAETAQFWEDRGELLAASDSGLFLLQGGQVVLYPFGAPARLRAVDAPRTSTVDLRDDPVTGLEELSKYARYPFGLDESGMARLLAALRRDSVVVRRAAAPPPAGASNEDLSTFLTVLADEGRRFARVEAAIAEGYRKLGPDFPGMGEHWVHPGRVIAGRLDPRRPPVLGYTEIGGDRRLVGFAYTRVMAPGDTPPSGPFPLSAWHDHSGGVDEESLLLSGPASMHPTGEAHRLAMVHIWIPVENPDDILAQNNWALPFVREGLPVPPAVTSEAGRALSLAGSGLAFYQELLEEGVGLEGEDLRAADRAFRASADEVRGWVESRRRGPETGTREVVAELEATWDDLWESLDATVSPGARRRLSVLHADADPPR